MLSMFSKQISEIYIYSATYVVVFYLHMDFKFRLILHVCFLYRFVMHIFIVQRIDLDFRSMHYIKNYIIIYYYSDFTGIPAGEVYNMQTR